MLNEEQILIVKNAINKYGVLNQLDMVIEECAELIQAINKARRNNIVDNNKIEITEANSIEECLIYYQLCSEVADVKIMLHQMELMLDKEAIQTSYERKLNRLRNRMQNESEHNPA